MILQTPKIPEESFDYKTIGFKAGLEIHAQIKSDRKLFCHCKPNLVDNNTSTDYTFERRFRPVLGEMGTFDTGMLVEYEKGYKVIYEMYDQCTYEMDETPPFVPDPECLKKGFMIANFFNCKSLVDEVVFNRKQYLDGSITTGFQRTTIIGRNGMITLSNGKKVRIDNVLIEEDAARRVNFDNRSNRTVYFNLDRLSVPLTEIITNHLDISNPEDLLESALIIGLSLRTNGIGKKGIGTVRQDINISITDGSRVELKGVQNILELKDICDREIQRQQQLLKIKDKLINAGIKIEDFKENFIEITQNKLSLLKGEGAFAVKLPKVKGVFEIEVQPKKLFSEEVFDRAELIAGIPLSAMYTSSMINSDDNQIMNELLGISSEDDFILIAIRDKKSPGTILNALSICLGRMKLALEGVPEETRRMRKDNNNEFLRVIHGKDRMYADTDTPPIPIDKDVIKSFPSDNYKPWKLLGKNKLSILELKWIIEKEYYSLFRKLADEFQSKDYQNIMSSLEAFHKKKQKEEFKTIVINEFDLYMFVKDIINGHVMQKEISRILSRMKDGKDYQKQRVFLLQTPQQNISVKSDAEHRMRQLIVESEAIRWNNVYKTLKNEYPMLEDIVIVEMLRNTSSSGGNN